MQKSFTGNTKLLKIFKYKGNSVENMFLSKIEAFSDLSNGSPKRKGNQHKTTFWAKKSEIFLRASPYVRQDQQSVAHVLTIKIENHVSTMTHALGD